jgi:Zn-dependent M32 family carboxypeptidase
LRKKIHHRGRRVPARALCVELTGGPLDHRPLIDYLNAKLSDLYGLSTRGSSQR